MERRKSIYLCGDDVWAGGQAAKNNSKFHKRIKCHAIPHRLPQPIIMPSVIASDWLYYFNCHLVLLIEDIFGFIHQHPFEC